MSCVFSAMHACTLACFWRGVCGVKVKGVICVRIVKYVQDTRPAH
jgi:hypothetical protein